MGEKKTVKMNVVTFILILVLVGLACVFGFYVWITGGFNFNKEATNNTANTNKTEQNTTNDVAQKDTTSTKIYAFNGRELSEFDLSFLKMENGKENMIYSPLSIKYALKMLEEGTTGDAKKQITDVIGGYNLLKYDSNKNMSLANALFINSNMKDTIKTEYADRLKDKYGAEVKFDSFKSADNVNAWIEDKTLDLIKNMLDGIDDDQVFLLVNALGIDMDWKNKFLTPGGEGWTYEHENLYGRAPEQVSSADFDKTQKVSGMRIEAVINNYDIIKELGEEKIKKTVGDEFKKWAKNLTSMDYEYNEIFDGDLSDENIEKKLQQYLDGGKYYSDYDSKGYMEELASNYGRLDYSTDFSFYTDDNVKVFAKDLKEYNGITMQYVGIMPTSESLDSYIKNVKEADINKLIKNLKSLESENFKQGTATKITGYIPKFDFDYELKLMEDLKEMGITDVFKQGKASLTNISDDENLFINVAIHKANIEFTQDGIKAAAATMMGGAGAGYSFDYIFDIPVEEIDLTFDKPYMFIIRDKDSGEVWFTGTVYEPLSWENEPEKESAW